MLLMAIHSDTGKWATCAFVAVVFVAVLLGLVVGWTIWG